MGTVCYPWLKLMSEARDSTGSKSSTSQAGDPGLNPGGGLTQVTQCMNERGRDYQP